MSPSLPARRATSSDVARRAGVSRSTVSQVLNGGADRFEPATVQRVLDAVHELEYRRWQSGLNLARGGTSTVVVLIPDTTYSRNLQDMADRLSGTIEQLGGTAALRFFRGGRDEIAPLLDMQPLAVIDFANVGSAARARMERSGILVAPVDEADGHPGVDDVGFVQAQVLSQGRVDHLVYALLEDHRLDAYGSYRADAVAREAHRIGLPSLVRVEVPLDSVGARRAMAPHLCAGTGVAAYNDDVAIAVVSACRELGLRVPEDVRVIGVDYTPVGQLVSPRLTTVAMDGERLVDAVADQLRALMQRRSPTPLGQMTIARPIIGETT